MTSSRHYGRSVVIGLFCLAVVLLWFTSSRVQADDASEPFPEVKGKFPSKSKSHVMAGETIDYCGKVKVVFDDGKLYKRPDEICYDYYFEGTGRFQIIDTSGLEVTWWHSFGDRRILEFSHAYICGSDFQRYLMLDPDDWQEDKIRREHWQKLQFMVGAPERYFWVNLSGELGILPNRDMLFPPIWIQFELTDGKSVVMYITPDMKEQMVIFHTKLDFSQPHLVAGYRIEECLDISPIDFDSSVISVNLKNYGKFEVATEIYFPAESALRGLNLSLPTWFKVDSVLDAHGHDLPYIKRKNRNYLYIAPRPESGDKPDHMSIYYRGKFLKPHYPGYEFPAHLTNWFPRLPRWTQGYFTIQYTFHNDLNLISPGILIDERDDGEYKTVTYTTDNIQFTSFAYGVYDTLRDSARGLPITLYVREENTGGLFNQNIPEEFLNGLKDAFEAFYDWFGPPSAASIRVVDQPWFLAQSSPGLIHLTMVTNLPTRFQPRIRSHEIAHQWWGNTVGTRSFRDVWLAEGLAEYSAALYVLRILNDTADFKEQIEEWRRDVVEEGRIGGNYSKGYKAGPIIMGTNLLKSNSPGDYYALTYSKAAYLLEMLHFEIDGPDFRTEFFNFLLAEYCRVFRGQQATSMDFIRVVANYIGPQRAATFFKHWLFDWRVPEFVCRYSVITDDRNRHTLNMEIEVLGVDADFETPFPVEVEFADGTRRLFRIDGVGQKKQHMLGAFLEEIEKVSFNPDHIILSRGIKVEKIR